MYFCHLFIFLLFFFSCLGILPTYLEDFRKSTVTSWAIQHQRLQQRQLVLGQRVISIQCLVNTCSIQCVISNCLSLEWLLLIPLGISSRVRKAISHWILSWEVKEICSRHSFVTIQTISFRLTNNLDPKLHFCKWKYYLIMKLCMYTQRQKTTN